MMPDPAGDVAHLSDVVGAFRERRGLPVDEALRIWIPLDAKPGFQNDLDALGPSIAVTWFSRPKGADKDVGTVYIMREGALVIRGDSALELGIIPRRRLWRLRGAFARCRAIWAR